MNKPIKNTFLNLKLIVINKKISGIYAITPNITPDFNIITQIIIKHKISILQYRHKTSNNSTKFDIVRRLRQLCLAHNTLFIVNDDVNLAKKTMADGVHLGKNDVSITKARQQLGANAIIGVSCYNSIDLALQAQDNGADYVAFGAIFPSSTKPNAIKCSINTITLAKKQVNIPIVAIGGINFDNKDQVFASGCTAVAMIDGLFNGF